MSLRQAMICARDGNQPREEPKQGWLSGINEHAALGRMCDSRRPGLFVRVLSPQAECSKLVNVPMRKLA
jgi:hypothetical protein